jgi:hypothetical protein
MTDVGKSIQQQADGISGKWSGLVTVFAGVGASLGLVAFGTMIRGAIEGAAKLHDVSQQSGIAVGALSALAAVGKTSETSLEAIAGASNRLAKNLSVATEESAGTSQAVKALGIDLDAFRAMAPEERMKALATALAGVKDGADKTAIAMALFGKQGAELLPFMADLAQTGELQARITEDQAAQADNFTDNLTKLKASGEGWKKELAMGMLPALNEASTATLKVMNGTGGLRDEIRKLAADGTLAEWTRSGVRGLTYVLDVVQYVGRGIKWVGELIGAAAGQAVQLAQGNFREAAAIGADFNARSVELFSAETLGARLRTSLDEARGAIDEVLQPKKDIKFNARAEHEAKQKKDADPSFMSYYDAALAEEKRLAAEKDALREYSKQQELAYWQNLLQNADLVGKDRVAITKKVADLEVQILREQAKQRQALDQEALKAQQDKALGAVELAQQEAAGQFQLGEMSKAQLLEQERGFEEQRNEIKREYLEARLAMIDPDRDPVAYAQASEQIEELERQHRMRLKQIQIEQAADAKDNPFTRTFESAQQSMATAIEGMINRTMTLKQALTSIWAGIRQAIVKEIATIIARKVAAWAVERAMALAGIGADAAKAGSGAAASVASIPYVGPALAIAAMVSTAAVGGMSSKVPSAARGFDIPAGVNPLTQLHEQEMVLPAEHANTIRALSAGGGGGGRSIELKAHPMPGNFFMIHRDALASALRELHRDGSITLS